jgi:hypothetical protein
VFWVELREHDDHAVLVWSEYLNTLLVKSTDPWFERVRFALLDEHGRLASEPLVVTPPEASAIDSTPRTPTSGPAGWPFMTSVARGMNGEVLVSYASQSASHRGVFVQRVRCGRR